MPHEDRHAAHPESGLDKLNRIFYGFRTFRTGKRVRDEVSGGIADGRAAI